MKLIIAGSRQIKNALQLVEQAMKRFYRWPPDLIISGGALGVDNAAQLYAEQHNIPFELVLAEWDIYGRAAGPMRNREMADLGTQLLAVWDGTSRGTKNMISEMLNRRKRVNLVLVKDGAIEFIEDYKG